MNIRIVSLCALLAVACAGTVAAAQALAQYSLNQGKVHFGVPVDWVAMMQKTSGDPQLYAFQVPNPKAPGTLTRVTVSTTHVADRTAFTRYVQSEVAKAVKMDHFHSEAKVGASTTTLRFTAARDGDKMRFREHFFYTSGLAVTLRCISPQHNPAPARWKQAYRYACHAIAAQLANQGP